MTTTTTITTAGALPDKVREPTGKPLNEAARRMLAEAAARAATVWLECDPRPGPDRSHPRCCGRRMAPGKDGRFSCASPHCIWARRPPSEGGPGTAAEMGYA